MPAAPAPVAAAVPAEAVADEPAAPPEAGARTDAEPLPDPETLKGLESEYRPFLRPGVDESLRRTALKRLFADPHFNVMDGLDVYIDDYSKPDPIPSAVLRTLNLARGLKLFDDEERAEAGGPERHAAMQQEPELKEAPAPDEQSLASQVPSTDCREATESTADASAECENDRKTG